MAGLDLLLAAGLADWEPWLYAFLFTQVVECPIYVAALRQHTGSLGAKVAIAAGASTVTHPSVWFVIPVIWYAQFGTDSYWSMVVVAEIFAIAVEAEYLTLFGLRRAYLWALGANGASVTLGLLSRYLFDWP